MSRTRRTEVESDMNVVAGTMLLLCYAIVSYPALLVVRVVVEQWLWLMQMMAVALKVTTTDVLYMAFLAQKLDNDWSGSPLPLRYHHHYHHRQALDAPLCLVIVFRYCIADVSQS